MFHVNLSSATLCDNNKLSDKYFIMQSHINNLIQHTNITFQHTFSIIQQQNKVHAIDPILHFF